MSSLRKQGSRLKNLDFKDSFIIILFRFLSKSFKVLDSRLCGNDIEAMQQSGNDIKAMQASN